MRKIRTIKDSNTIISEMLESMLVCVNKLKEGLEMLSDQHSKLQEENRTQEKIKNRQEVTLIHGVSGLAKHLGCGKNKAQNILNSNILQEEGYSIQSRYKMGYQCRYAARTIRGRSRILR